MDDRREADEIFAEIDAINRSLGGSSGFARLKAAAAFLSGLLLLGGALFVLDLGDSPWSGLTDFYAVIWGLLPGLVLLGGGLKMWRRIARSEERRRVLEERLRTLRRERR